MASVSSTSSTSSSLGNTALRGFGGLSSGLDRDSLIEQMTAGTTAKITAKKQAMTKLQWKQEAYRSISGKILDLQDTYMSYTATKSLKNSDFFAKSKITATGDSDYTKYITATGDSDAASRVSVLGVTQTARAASLISHKKGVDPEITTSVTKDNFTDSSAVKLSNLSGLNLAFGTYDYDATTNSQKFNKQATFTFPSSYKDEDGETHTINYTGDIETLKDDLNAALNAENFLGKDGNGAGIQFALKELDDGTKVLQIEQVDGQIDSKYKDRILLSPNNTAALSAMGFSQGDLTDAQVKDGISFDEFNGHTSSFEAASISKESYQSYFKGKSISITYGSETKSVDLIRKDDTFNTFDEFLNTLQTRIDQAFGKNKITVYDKSQGADNSSLSFKAADGKSTIEVSADSLELRNALGISENQSNTITTGESLWSNRTKLGFDENITEEEFNKQLAEFSINGAKITGLTADTTVKELLTAINKNKDAGVTATYVSNEGKFILTANEKGSRREIELGAGAAKTIFGIGDDESDPNRGQEVEGLDAEMKINYNGMETTLKSTSNTFEIDGLKITASSTFDASAAGGVSFSASANVDDVTERVKQFIEDYNALIQETRDQVTTRPDSDYSPLTDDQKKEMDETSIKNWEDKAKEGILFSSTALKDMNISVQSIFATMMQNGISYDDLESIGITASDDYSEGGKLIFDEDKFKSAMETDPDLVSDLFTGNHGIVQTINDTLKPYATRYASQNGGSYGSLIEEAGSDKLSLTLTNNSIYTQLKEMEEAIASLKTQLSTEQDRYIQQFTTMETLISQMNTQSSYLSQLAG